MRNISLFVTKIASECTRLLRPTRSQVEIVQRYGNYPVGCLHAAAHLTSLSRFTVAEVAAIRHKPGAFDAARRTDAVPQNNFTHLRPKYRRPYISGTLRFSK